MRHHYCMSVAPGFAPDGMAARTHPARMGDLRNGGVSSWRM